MSKMSNQKEGENTLIKIEINNKNYSMNRFELLEFLSLSLVSDKTLNSSSEYLDYTEDLKEGESLDENSPEGEYVTELSSFIKGGENTFKIVIKNEKTITDNEFWDIIEERPNEEN